MSISASLSNAYSGLTASARTAEVIAQNVSNTLTEGYGRREVELVPSSVGGQGAGVRVAGVMRRVDMALVSARQQADATVGDRSTRSNAILRLEQAMGLPGEGDSLADRISALETAFTAAASRPDQTVRLQNIVYASQDIVAKITDLADETQILRMDADNKIGTLVTTLNENLADISQLNRDIRLAVATGRDANGLEDQRQILIDQISEIVPLRTIPRDHRQIALVTMGGSVLVDGPAAEFAFSPVGQITSDMTLQSGALSGLTMNGRQVVLGTGGGMDGGALSALFAQRDEQAPDASAELDAIARSLVERFEDAGPDLTRPAGTPGLFTDAGQVFDVADEEGLAGRLALNAVVDPAAGGEYFRLRDGLGAASAGATGQSTLLVAFATALSEERSIASGSFASMSFSLSGVSSAVLSQTSAARLDAERQQVFAVGRQEELRTAELDNGVNTDAEMQHLLLVEKAYAANARVVSAADEMLNTLLGI